MAQYTKSLVSYFDILGFRKIVAEAPSPEYVASKLQALARFSSPDNTIGETFGNTFTNFSDLVLRTVPVDPNSQLRGGEGLLYWELLDLVHVQAELIADGVLGGYILSSYSARKLGLKTTGNAGGAHNLIVAAARELDQIGVEFAPNESQP